MSHDPHGHDRPPGDPYGSMGTGEHRTEPVTTAHSPGHDSGHSSSGSSPNAGVITPQGRPGVYIYPFWQRTEFWVMLLIALAVAIAAAIEDGFPAEDAWTLITILGASYILSRGFAKREPRDDSNDRPWTPGPGR